MMAAGTAASRGLHVLLIEKNDNLGKKLAITGKGRCNVTNEATNKEVMANIISNGKFMYSALERFSPSAVFDFFEGLGVPLKTERGGRIFPMSDKAGDIVSALRKYCTSNGVSIVKACARKIVTEDGAVRSVVTDKGEFFAPNVLLCTGGASYPGTGSTGDGYRMARELGHNVIDPKPSLVPLNVKGDVCGRMQGFSLRNVRVSVYNGQNKLIFDELGEMLFTHFGVSGPLALSASAHMRDFENDKYTMKVDLKPALDEKKLDARILRDFAKFANRDFQNALDELAGRSMIPVLVELSGIPPETKVNSVTKEQRRRLVELFKAFTLEIEGPRPIAEAIVTAGGVDVRQVNPRTMESKLVSGLYFAGELLDLDAYTGGFNLQIAWSTSYTAGMSVSAAE